MRGVVQTSVTQQRFAISIFSTFKGPQYALTPSKTALTTAPTQVS